MSKGAPALAKGTASFGLASATETVTSAEAEALGPWARREVMRPAAVEGLKRRGDVSSTWRVVLGPEKVRESCLAPQYDWQNESSINVNSECRLSDSALGQQIALGRTVQPCQPTKIHPEYDTSTGTHESYHTSRSAKHPDDVVWKTYSG
jgi:hypothetical protein